MKNIPTETLEKALNNAGELYTIFLTKNEMVKLHIECVYYAIKLELSQRKSVMVNIHSEEVK